MDHWNGFYIILLFLTPVSASKIYRTHSCGNELDCSPDAECDQGVCVCHQEFVGDGVHCATNECTSMECAENGLCQPFAWYNEQELEISFRCVCEEGYFGDGVDSCTLGPCAPGRHNCSQNAVCMTDLSGDSFKCFCKSGYIGDGTTCHEDKCSSKAQLCSGEGQKCLSTIQGHICVCKEGYFEVEGGRCVQNPCDAGRHHCGENSVCLSLLDGSYSCSCSEHFYKSESGGCILHPCLSDSNSCDKNAECSAVYGPDGLANAQYKCQCKEGFYGDGFSCSADPCESENSKCPPNSSCVSHNNGAYKCECNPTFYNLSNHCELHPCFSDSSPCDPNAWCIPAAAGSAQFTCHCLVPYVGDGATCHLADTPPIACTEDEFLCEMSGRCIPNKWVLDKLEDCPDGEDEMEIFVDLCKLGRHDCHPEAECVNTPGRGYSCNCKHSHTGDGRNCYKRIKLPPVQGQIDIVPNVSHLNSTTPAIQYVKCTDANVYRCENSSFCIPMEWILDGSVDCPKGDDEVPAAIAFVDECALGTHRCSPLAKCTNLIDGKYTCESPSGYVGSTGVVCAEANSTAQRALPPSNHSNFYDRLPGRCENEYFDCGDSSPKYTCVPFSKFRDGSQDCPDGSDEQCFPGQVRCGNLCVNPEDYSNSACTGRKSCSEPASNVPAFCKMTKEKLCAYTSGDVVPCQGYGECILRRWLMDGKADCRDGSDEKPEYVSIVQNRTFFAGGSSRPNGGNSGSGNNGGGNSGGGNGGSNSGNGDSSSGNNGDGGSNSGNGGSNSGNGGSDSGNGDSNSGSGGSDSGSDGDSNSGNNGSGTGGDSSNSGNGDSNSGNGDSSNSGNGDTNSGNGDSSSGNGNSGGNGGSGSEGDGNSNSGNSGGDGSNSGTGGSGSNNSGNGDTNDGSGSNSGGTEPEKEGNWGGTESGRNPDGSYTESEIQRYADCINNETIAARNKFGGKALCKCEAGRMPDKDGNCIKTTSGTIELQATKICGRDLKYSAGLSDPNDPEFEKQAELFLLSLSRVLENVGLSEAIPQLCLPQRPMKDGSVYFWTTMECKEESECKTVRILHALQTQTAEQGISFNPTHVQKVDDCVQELDDCHPDAQCFLNGFTYNCECTIGFVDSDPLMPGRDCVESNDTLPTASPPLKGAAATCQDVDFLGICMPLVVMILLCLVVFALLLILLYVLYRLCCKSHNHDDQVVPLDQPEDEHVREAWSASPTLSEPSLKNVPVRVPVQRQRTESIPNSIQSLDAGPHQVEAVIEERVSLPSRASSTPTMWDLYRRYGDQARIVSAKGAGRSSVASRSSRSSVVSKSSVGSKRSDLDPVLSAVVAQTPSGRLSLIPEETQSNMSDTDSDQYELWKRKMTGSTSPDLQSSSDSQLLQEYGMSHPHRPSHQPESRPVSVHDLEAGTRRSNTASNKRRVSRAGNRPTYKENLWWSKKK